MSTWVDFRALRKSLSFEKVLEQYGVAVRRKPGNRHVGPCPLPTHTGKKRSPSFSAKLGFGVWHCFSCGAGGNVLEFAVRMEGLDPANRQDLRKVALQLQERYGVPSPVPEPERRAREAAARTPDTRASLPVIVNPPLDFELKDLDYEHPYLRDRGFYPETIRHFGLGYCNRGLMKGRVVIPLHDSQGRLIGYAGRLVDDAAVCDRSPKYLFPGNRERNGQRIEFRKSLFVYNGCRIKGPVDDPIVVEGFASVWWLHQLGFPQTVAVMGASCSAGQAEAMARLVTPDGRTWILSDGDEAGAACAASVAGAVAAFRWCRRVPLAHGQQPTDLTAEDVTRMLPNDQSRKEVMADVRANAV